MGRQSSSLAALLFREDGSHSHRLLAMSGSGSDPIWNEGAEIMGTPTPLTWEPKTSYIKMQNEVVSQGMMREKRLEMWELCFPFPRGWWGFAS